MRLTVYNFFTTLIFQPFEADTKKDQCTALAASVLLVFFTLGLCHAVCALRNYCFSHRPPEQATEQDGRVAQARDRAISKKKDITVKINPEVKAVLDQLFIDSPYAIDTLPIYPLESKLPKRKHMTAPVMKGVFDNGRPFIAIQVDSILQDKDIENNICPELQEGFKAHRHRREILILNQCSVEGPLFWGGDGKFLWDQHPSGTFGPDFFAWNFTYAEDGSGPTKTQQGKFKQVQMLLKTGESQDINGRVWRIPGHAR